MVGRHPAVVVGEDGGEERGEAGEAQQPGHHCTGRLKFLNFDIDTFEKPQLPFPLETNTQRRLLLQLFFRIYSTILRAFPQKM